MKASGIGRVGKTGVVALALVGTIVGNAHAQSFTALDAAWKEAVILAGVAEESVARPQIVPVPDAPSPYYLMVQEFLGSIYDQTRSMHLASYAAGRPDSKDSWVKEKMGWRVRSRAFTQTALLN